MAVLIDPPAPPQPPTGLLTAAVGPLPLPLHATLDGLQYVLDSCGNAEVQPAACDTDLTLDYEGSDGIFEATPFLVVATAECGAAGTSNAETEARVRRRLQLKEQRAVERAFWGGTAEVPGYLQNLGTVDVLAPVLTGGMTAAISVLDQALADNYGLPGFIHVRPRLAAWMANAGVLRWDGGTPRTPRGNVIVMGDGYSGAGPDGEAPAGDGSTEWVYATGRVVVWRDPEVVVPSIPQVFDRTYNQKRAVAMRTYALGVECYAAAVNVTIGDPV